MNDNDSRVNLVTSGREIRRVWFFLGLMLGLLIGKLLEFVMSYL